MSLCVSISLHALITLPSINNPERHWLAHLDAVVENAARRVQLKRSIRFNIRFVPSFVCIPRKKELVTAPVPLDHGGVTLAGVTRDSIVRLVKQWPEWTVTERDYSMNEIVAAARENRLLEAFGAGTAVVVSPIQSITFQGKVLYRYYLLCLVSQQLPDDVLQEYDFPLGDSGKAGPLTQKISDTLLGIQYGEIKHDWSVVVA